MVLSLSAQNIGIRRALRSLRMTSCLHHHNLSDVTRIIPARFLNQEQGSYFYWEFQVGIKERITDVDCIRMGVESP